MARRISEGFRSNHSFHFPVLELLESRLPPGNVLSGINVAGEATLVQSPALQKAARDRIKV